MILEFDGIQFKYTEEYLLTGIYVKSETNRITGLLGRNGSGKSTLLKIAFGSLRTDVISVRIDETYINPPAFSNRAIAYLPQDSFIPSYLTVREILKLYKIDPDRFVPDFPEIPENLNKKKFEMSGGTVRLLENLLVLFSPASFCFFDEPFTGLSPVMIERLVACMHEEKKNKGLIVTDHLYKQVVAIADDLYLLLNGKTYVINDPDDLIRRGYILG
jgi:ABC-type multidrug transport system ATPase subunit